MNALYKWCKQIGGVVLHKMGVGAFPSGGCLVLTYHRVTESPVLDDGLCVSVGTFDRQLAYLKAHYSILSGEEFARILCSGKSFPPKSCLITFDDGWRDNYDNAYPLLRRHELPAVIFLATDFIGSVKKFWHTELEDAFLGTGHENFIRALSHVEGVGQSVLKMLADIAEIPVIKRRPWIHVLIEYLKIHPGEREVICRETDRIAAGRPKRVEPVMLSWTQVQEMAKGGIAFGAHSCSHALLDQLSREGIEQELICSRDAIVAQLGMPVSLFCYPNGNYNGLIASLVKDSGFVAAFTCVPGISTPEDSSPFEWRRVHILEDMCLDFRGNFVGMYFEAELSCARRLVKNWGHR